MFVATNVFSQAYFCRDKRCILLWQTPVCHDKHVFAVTKLLSRQKLYLWQLPPMIVFSYKTDSTFKCLEACHNTNFMQSLSRTSTYSQNIHQVNSADYHAPCQVLLTIHNWFNVCLFFFSKPHWNLTVQNPTAWIPPPPPSPPHECERSVVWCYPERQSQQVSREDLHCKESMTICSSQIPDWSDFARSDQVKWPPVLCWGPHFG